MRRSLTKIPYPVIGRATATPSIAAAFSTSSGGGRGRGGGTPFQFTVDSPSQTEPENPKYDDLSPPPIPNGHGRGRGNPLPSSPIFPSFSPLLNNDSKAQTLGRGRGRGRGFIPNNSNSPPPKPNIQLPIQFTKGDEADDNLGAGLGKVQSERPAAENRHIRQQAKPRVNVVSDVAAVDKGSPKEELSQEEKVRKAIAILSRGEEQGGRGGGAGGGRGRGRGRGRFGGRGRRDERDESDDEFGGLYVGDPAEEEKLAKRLGPKIMNQLAEGFEEMSSRVLPSPMDDAYYDALHTNLLIECEPEYLMEEFGTNPDIDEKPPIPLRDALEKMKPFLMAYEGIKSQEEWEEVIEETMKTVPLMKEIVDYYSGPDRVTAKQQQEELDRVAKTLPASAPASVKRFTERAVLSLQSNPGWGFDKKCQFMDKLVMEVSQQYK